MCARARHTHSTRVVRSKRGSKRRGVVEGGRCERHLALLLDDDGEVEVVDEGRDDALHGRAGVVVLDHSHPPLLVQRDLLREPLTLMKFYNNNNNNNNNNNQ